MIDFDVSAPGSPSVTVPLRVIEGVAGSCCAESAAAAFAEVATSVNTNDATNKLARTPVRICPSFTKHPIFQCTSMVARTSFWLHNKRNECLGANFLVYE